MNKFGLTAIACLAILLLGTPFATGTITESRLTERIAEMGENAFVVAEVTDYQRGWLTSAVRIEFGISPEYFEQLEAIADAPPIPDFLTDRVAVLVDIEHGPIAYREELHFGLARVTATPDPESTAIQAIVNRYGMPYLFEFHGRAGFGARFEYDADIPAVDYAGPEGEILFSGLVITGAVTGNVVEADGLAAEFSFQNPFASAILESLSFETEFQMREDGLPLGRSSFAIDSFVAASPLAGQEPVLLLDGLTFSSAFSINAEGDSLDASVLYAVAAATASDGYTVSDAGLGIGFEGVDAAAVTDYYALVQESALAGSPDPETLMQEIASIGERIVRRGVRFTIMPIQFTMPEGAFDGSVTVDIDGSSLPAGQPLDVRNIPILLGLITASAEVSVAKPLAERLAVMATQAQLAASNTGATPEELADMAEAQAGFMLVGLVGQGMLVDDGDSYSAELDYDGTGITVNGAPMPFGLP